MKMRIHEHCTSCSWAGQLFSLEPLKDAFSFKFSNKTQTMNSHWSEPYSIYNILLPRGRLGVVSRPKEKYNIQFTPPEENLQYWHRSLHTHNSTPEKFPSATFRTLHHLTIEAPGRKFTILAPHCQQLMPGTIRKT